MKQLLDTGKVDVDSKGMFGRTPLSWAAEKGHETIVKQLLDTGKVDVDLNGIFGRTPLLWAAECNEYGIPPLTELSWLVDTNLSAYST